MDINQWTFPEELLYDTHYQWIRSDGHKIVFGLTPYGLDITGDVLYLALPAVGTNVGFGDSCGSLEAGKWVGRVYAPASGRVTSVNHVVASSPGMINQSPYECWFAEIELVKSEELTELMTASALAAWLAEDRNENV
jgi:glycine cleavage system H protein